MNETDHDTTAHSASKRKRARQACEPCRKRKKKCDGRHPCQLCLDFEYDCSYSNGDNAKRTISAASSPDTRRSIIHGTNGTPTTDATHSAAESRPADVSSVLTFPDVLANSLDSGEQRQGKTLIYTLGLRNILQPAHYPSIRNIIDLEEVLRYTKVYFATVHMWHDYLVQSDVEAHVVHHWRNPSHRRPTFEVHMAFIVALGSLFSWPSRFEHEEQLVAHAVSWMESDTLSEVNNNSNFLLAAAYVERTVYFRATGSPRKAWMASCAAVHMAESIGLHKESNKIPVATVRDQLCVGNSDMQTRLFWLAKNINTMISTEYGRSRVPVVGITCVPDERLLDDPGQIWQRLVSLLPEDSYCSNELLEQACIDFVERLADIDGIFNYSKLIQGEMVCLAYRRLLSINSRIPDSTRLQILTLGESAMKAAIELANESLPWWKLIQTPFQFLCTLLSLDKDDSLPLVSKALETIAHVDRIFHTSSTKDAYEKAQLLIRYALSRKENEVKYLKEALPASDPDGVSAQDDLFGDLDVSWFDVMNSEFWGIDVGFQQ